MSDQSSSEASIYRPFPKFDDWVKVSTITEAFDKYADLLRQAKSNTTKETLSRALTTAMRYAAVDTGAIEGLYEVDRGFTRTVATQAISWEFVVSSRGAHVRPAIEDALRAYEFVLDAATERVEISEYWIRQLHQIICKSQDTYTVYTSLGPQERELPKGQYKTLSNSPSLPNGRTHAYAPVDDTAPEMYRLVTELRSEKFQASHPIMQAAYAHYAYVCIHPFADGNGRLARALASVYLYRNPGIPLVIFADQRMEYFDSLERADAGHYEFFNNFIALRIIDTVGIVRASLTQSAPTAAESIRSLQSLFGPPASDPELAAAAAALMSVALQEAIEQVHNLTLPGNLGIQSGPGKIRSVRPPTGYAPIDDEHTSMWISIKGDWPVEVFYLKNLRIFVRNASWDGPDLIAVTEDKEGGVEFWVREMQPVISATARLKVSSWVEGVVAQLLYETNDIATKKLTN